VFSLLKYFVCLIGKYDCDEFLENKFTIGEILVSRYIFVCMFASVGRFFVSNFVSSVDDIFHRY